MPYKDPAKHREMQKRSYQRHRTQKLAYGRIYAQTHREQTNARQRERYNTEEGRAKGRAQSLAHLNKYRDKINARRRARRRLFPEKVRAEDKRWNDSRREAINARRRARHRANPQQRLEEAKRYYARHSDRARARHHVWYLRNLHTHLPRQRRYRQLNPDVPRLSAARRNARKRNLPDTFTRAERQFMLEYWHHACAVCGNQEGFFWTLADDHFIALSSPDCPGTVADNMLPLCHGRGGCNNAKNDRDAAFWLMATYPPAKAKRILKAIDAYFAVVRTRHLSAAAD